MMYLCDENLLCHKCKSGTLVKTGKHILCCPNCGARQLSVHGYIKICSVPALITLISYLLWVITWLASGTPWFKNISLITVSIGFLAVTSGLTPKLFRWACMRRDGQRLLYTGILTIALQLVCLVFFFVSAI